MDPNKKKKEKELFEEVSSLKNRLSELESQLEENKKLNKRLRNDAEKKITAINDVNKRIAKENEQHKWKKEHLISKISDIEIESARKTEIYNQTEKDITINLSGFDDVEYENKKLQERLRKISIEYYDVQLVMQEERELRKQNNFELNLKLDSVLRQTIAKFNKQYLERANSTLEEEATLAMQDNKRLFEEYGLREQACGALVDKQLSSFEERAKLHLEKEVVAATTDSQEQSCISLEREISKINENIEKLQNDVAMKLIELEVSKNDFATTKKLNDDTKIATRELEAQKKHVDLIKKLVLTIGRKIIKEGIEIIKKNRTDALDNSQQCNETDDEKKRVEDEVSIILEGRNEEFSISNDENSSICEQQLGFDTNDVWMSKSTDCPYISKALRRFLMLRKRNR